jgi:hypothetical protein
MKYIIILFTLILFGGCSDHIALSESESFVVTNFESITPVGKKTSCVYNFSLKARYGSKSRTYFSITDKCGMYTVGDTLFTRKK